MKPFSKLYSDFWINYDNSEVIGLGAEAQLLSLYLQGNSHHNILGVYCLPLLYVASDLKLPINKVQITLRKLCNINYCQYDKKAQYIWVCNLALEQIGDNIDIKDNRVKAIHAIWQSLPSRLEFLEEIYQKYKTAFHLKARSFEKPSTLNTRPVKETERIAVSKKIKETKELKTFMAVTDASSSITTNNIDTDTMSTTSDTAASFSINNKEVVTQTINEALPLPPPFIGGIKLSQITSEGNLLCNVSEKGLETTPSKLSVPPLEGVSNSKTSLGTNLDVYQLNQNPSESATSKEESLIGLSPSKGLRSPLQSPSKDLPSPFEAPLEPLRSNIEYRIKNIENRKKNTEERKKKEDKEKRDIHSSNVLTPNIVAQARPVSNFKTHNFFDKGFLFFNNSHELEAIPEEPRTVAVSKAEALSNAIAASGVVKNCHTQDFSFPIIQVGSNSASERRLDSCPSLNLNPDAVATESGLGLDPDQTPGPNRDLDLGPGPGSSTDLSLDIESNIDFNPILSCSSYSSSSFNATLVSSSKSDLELRPTLGLDIQLNTSLSPNLSLNSSSEPNLILVPNQIVNQKLNLTPITELKSKQELIPKQTPKATKPKNNMDESIAAVFSYWKETMEHPRSHLDNKRKTLISNALKWGYTVQELCDAIKGCSITPHNKGINEQKQRYDGLHIILGAADQIDRFIRNCAHPPRPPPLTEAHRRLDANVSVANNWIENKLKQAAGSSSRSKKYG